MIRTVVTALALSVVLSAAIGCDDDPSSTKTPNTTNTSDPDGSTGGDSSSNTTPPSDGPIADNSKPGDDGSPPPPPPGCTVFPPDNYWNIDISNHPVHANSDNIIASIGNNTGLHTDFGEGTNGIPYIVVDDSEPMIDIHFVDDGDTESDPGPYPIPLDAPIEDGSDRHVIGVDLDNCMLYELYLAYPKPDKNRWNASFGAIFNLKSNKLRPISWTAADAAGLPIYAGLVRYDEVQTGVINHALRFTVEKSRRAYILPATHWASESTNPDHPPMGMRFRLKADVDISGFSKTNQVILTALKKYGMFMADNGADWFLSGAPHDGWDDEDLLKIRDTIKGKHFEVVDTGPIETTYK